MSGRDHDVAILGGGLAGGLIALALARLRPELDVLLVEQGERLGGHHTWSFFASDVAPEDAWLVEPLVAASWDGYEVRFPSHARTLHTPYRTIVSEALDTALRGALAPASLLTGAQVTSAGQESLALADGRSLHVGGVIDARGAAGLPQMTGGWQKFMGLLLRCDRPHGLARPVVMDAQVEQIDGYRFVYCLPFSETDMLVEDTYYSDDPNIDALRLRARIDDYARSRGWRVTRTLREESGVLPVIGGGDFAAFWPGPGSGPARAGAGAGLLHPLTSYSLPDAVRFAQHICRLPNLSGAALAEASYAWALAHWRQGRFYRMLTRMLFGAGEPQYRFRMLERFYRLPRPLIERFYAGRLTATDKLRIVAGRPPVPLIGALASLVGGQPLAVLARQA
jgi:lycopene beta-cyclase